ncbi:MAG: SusC/RagA family TonB-linked outer membrane protein, partial [Bacteroidales bacterium]
GTVKNKSGELLPGVTVVVKGSTTGTLSDVEGRYTLGNIAPGSTLLFSFVGMSTQEHVVQQSGQLNITLLSDAIGLEEVVAIGYGVISKRDITGSVASVNADNLSQRGSASVVESLQGQVAGVQIQQSSSRAGDGFTVQIRGKSSLQEGSPLYVIDGVVSDNMDFLNPMDIETVDVLKDASSTAIYGSRATNGVLLITTKKGTEVARDTKVMVSYDGYYGVKTAANMPDFMNGDEFMRYRFSRYISSSFTPATGATSWEMTPANFGNFWGADSEVTKQIYKEKRYTDWEDIVLRTGRQQNHFVNISGNSKAINYRVGFGYQDEKGVVYDAYKRYNIKTAFDTRINEKLTAGFSANFALSLQDKGSKKSIMTGFRMAPYLQAYYWDGHENAGQPILQPGKDKMLFPNGGGPTSAVNPIIDRENSVDQKKSYYTMANLYLEYEPIQDLKLKTTFSPYYQKLHNGVFYGESSEERRGKTNYTESVSDDVFSYTWDSQLNYDKKFGGHKLSALGLFSVYNETREGNSISVVNMPFDVNWYNLASGEVQNQDSHYERVSMLSYVLRLNYDYLGKYMLTLSSRWDGSSKFSEGQRWGMFPSVAAAWRMSEEDFLQSQDWLSNLKWRASFGLTGNNSLVGAYATQVLANEKYYYNFGNNIANGFGSNLTNPNLTWEKTTEVNIGLDFGIIDNRISGSIDAYHKVSRELLMEMQTPLELGSASGNIWSNVGKVRNYGLEVQLSTVNVKTKKLNWTTSFTFASNQNEIMELNDRKEDLVGNRWFIGQPIDVVYGYVCDGIASAEEAAAIATNDKLKTKFYEGEMKFKDSDGSGTVDANDRRVQGHAAPSWTGSLNSSLTYQNFDFSFSIYTSQGSTVYSPFMYRFGSYSSRGQNILDLDFYIPDGAPILGSDGTIAHQKGTQHGTYPFPTSGSNNAGGGSFWKNNEDGSQYYVDNSFWRVKNITLGYTLPKQLMQKTPFSFCRFYFNLINPLTFTSYRGFDPEWADASVDDGSGGVSTRTFQFGVNVKF